MELLPVFLMGAVGTFLLLTLKKNGQDVFFFLLPTLGFCSLGSSMFHSDWRVSLSNLVSMAVLFFLPVVAVIYMQKVPNKYLASRQATVILGGINTLLFPYPGLALAFVLGVE